MRRALLFFLILFILPVGCARWRGRPIPPEGLPWAKLTPFRAQVHYELTIPRRHLKGRLRLLGNRKGCLYFEASTPFGLSFFQGLLIGSQILAVFFPERTVYCLRLRFPTGLEGGLPYLLTGCIPPTWGAHFSRAFAKKNRLRAYFTFEGTEARVTWEGQELREVVIWQGNDLLLVTRYQTTPEGLKVSLKCPAWHVGLQLAFREKTPVRPPGDFCHLRFPSGFRVLSYTIALTR